ncbi:hypothetical protein D3C87_2006950 [compost metagenome]
MLRQKLTTQLKTADIRQPHVENGQSRSLPARFIQRRKPTLKGFHGESFLRKHVNERLGNATFIFNQPNQRLLHRDSLH